MDGRFVTAAPEARGIINLKCAQFTGHYLCLNAGNWNMFEKLRGATPSEWGVLPHQYLNLRYGNSVGITPDGTLFVKKEWGEFQK